MAPDRRRPQGTMQPTGRGDRGLLRRGPHLPAACRVRGRRPGARGRDLRRGRGRLAGLLGPPGRRPRHLVRRVAHDPRLGPALRQVVRRRHPQRVVQLPRPPRRGRPGPEGRLPLGGRAGRPAARSPTPTCSARSQRFANVLKGLGVGKGDRVAIYMPMIPELPVAMLACARIGAPHSVVFGGFSADSLADRINDAECKVLVTADGGFRRGQAAPAQAHRRRGAGLDPVDRARRGRRPGDRPRRCRRGVGRHDRGPRPAGSTT